MLTLSLACATLGDSSPKGLDSVVTDTGFVEGWTEPIGAVAVSMAPGVSGEECVLFENGGTECETRDYEPDILLDSISITIEGGCGIGKDGVMHCWGEWLTWLPEDYSDWMSVRTARGVYWPEVCGTYASGAVWCGYGNSAGVAQWTIRVEAGGAIDAAPGGNVFTVLDAAGTVRIFSTEDGTELSSFDGVRGLVGVDIGSTVLDLDGHAWWNSESDGEWVVISDAPAVVAVGQNLTFGGGRVFYVDEVGEFHEDDLNGVEPRVLAGLDDPPAIVDMDCFVYRCTLVAEDGRLYRLHL